MTQPVNPTHDAPLTKLRDSDLVLADDRQDIRGRVVIDQDGTHVGHVKALFIDEADRKVRMLDIGGGGFLGIGEEHFLVPIDAITAVSEKDVRVNETAHRIKKSPAYDPTLVAAYNHDFWAPYYGYYGGYPYWDSAYRYPEAWFH